MARAVRRVSRDWVHPEDDNGLYIPLERLDMPDWLESEKTHVQMYNETCEGVPVSPIFSTAHELSKWLVSENVRYFSQYTATYEEWLHTILTGETISVCIDTPNSTGAGGD